MPDRATGYLIDHPVAIAAREKPTLWTFGVLLGDRPRLPLAAVPDFDHDCGPILDQDGVGACVAFAATVIRSYQESIDEHQWAFNTDSAFVAYDWLKHGHGAFPGDGIPDTEGSYAAAVWKMALVEGIPGKDGNARKIAAYYRLTGTPGSAPWVDEMFQVAYEFGPVSVSSMWPTNWFSGPITGSGIMPPPSGASGGHMYTLKGKRTIAGVVYARMRNTWNDWGVTDSHGRDGEFLVPVSEFSDPLLHYDEVWKTIDKAGDGPTPGGAVVPATDKVARLLSIAVGTQFFTIDTNQPLVKLGGTAPAKVYSPFSISTSQYAVIISTGGVLQEARVNKSAVTVLASSPIT